MKEDEEGDPRDALRDLMTELRAMEKIAAALAELGTDEARQRVLRWADRFPAAPSPPSRSASARRAVSVLRAAPSAPSEEDGMLSIEGLALFEERSDGPGAAEADRSVETTIKSFVADFQRVARDWKGE